MQEIAEGAGIKKPTIYLYYPSKGELFLSIVDALAQTMEKAVSHAMSELGGESLEVLLRGVFLCQADLMSRDQLLLLRRAMTMSLCYVKMRSSPGFKKPWMGWTGILRN